MTQQTRYAEDYSSADEFDRAVAMEERGQDRDGAMRRWEHQLGTWQCAVGEWVLAGEATDDVAALLRLIRALRTAICTARRVEDTP